MFDFITKSPVWHLITISDWMSKYVVMLGLFILSVICVAIIIYKALIFSRQKKQMTGLMKAIKQCKSLGDIATVSKTFDECVGGKFLTGGLALLKSTLEEKKASVAPNAPQLSTTELDNLELMMAQETSNLLMEEERYLPVLGTSAAVGPLAGLFGTIWGLIYAFIQISQEKSSDIATVAPGIASALLTTLVGLIVAIPAMVAFHYFANELRKLEAQLNDMHDLFVSIVKQTLMR